jgi:hypothetical protein
MVKITPGVFRSVFALSPGELVDTETGHARVLALTTLAEQRDVFNLEVENDHTYFVGTTGAWVHNTCCGGAGGAFDLTKNESAGAHLVNAARLVKEPNLSQASRFVSSAEAETAGEGSPQRQERGDRHLDEGRDGRNGEEHEDLPRPVERRRSAGTRRHIFGPRHAALRDAGVYGREPLPGEDRVSEVMNDDERALRDFLSAYLHQDWPVEFASYEDAVDEYLTDEPRIERVAGAARALRALAASSATEDALVQRLLDELGSYYDPRPDRISVRDWLTSIAERLETATRPGPR